MNSPTITQKIVELGTDLRLHVWYELDKPNTPKQRSYFVLFPDPKMEKDELRALAMTELKKLGNPQVVQSVLVQTVKEEFLL